MPRGRRRTVKPGSDASATSAARPTPVSSMPPARAATPAARHVSSVRRASSSPPTSPALMLTTRHAPSSIASRATDALVIVSSRPIGVRSRAARRAWSSSASGASGCSMHARSNASSSVEVIGVGRACSFRWRRPGASRSARPRRGPRRRRRHRDRARSSTSCCGSPRPRTPADHCEELVEICAACRPRPRRRRAWRVLPRCVASERPSARSCASSTAPVSAALAAWCPRTASSPRPRRAGAPARREARRGRCRWSRACTTTWPAPCTRPNRSASGVTTRTSSASFTAVVPDAVRNGCANGSRTRSSSTDRMDNRHAEGERKRE